uniref:Nucleotide exchange factor Fes1 domain-containing protein n=1 Tax=Setaria digitata TaxID=48799 RepID=A0A915PW64_9BILA
MSEQNAVAPQCWSKLLCLAQSANDGSGDKSSQLMSTEDRKFVESAMAEAVQLTDPVKHMTKYIEQLKLMKDPSKDDVNIIAEIVENLEDLVCDIDLAADFCKLGGLVEVIRILKSDCDSVRCEVARLISLLAQNNPYVQNIMLETDLLPYLLTVLEEIEASEDLVSRTLSGLSAIVRAHEKAFNQFRKLNGLEKIVDVFQQSINNNNLKIANKAVLITTSIATSLGPDVKRYNVLSILFRMALQLSPDSVGCSYFFDYLMNNIVDKERDDNDLTNGDEFKISYMELDIECKQQFHEFLERHLEHEEQPSNELQNFLTRIRKKVNMVPSKETRNLKLGEGLSSNL